MTVYLHWPDATYEAVESLPNTRRAPYETEDEALWQAVHDLDAGSPVAYIADEDGNELVSLAQIKARADEARTGLKDAEKTAKLESVQVDAASATAAIEAAP